MDGQTVVGAKFSAISFGAYCMELHPSSTMTMR